MRRFLLVAAAVCWAGGDVSVSLAGGHGTNGCPQCHVSHNALRPTDPNSVGPLWALSVSSKPLASFTLYSSRTFDALNTGITQPDGPSKMCLACHDGSYSGVSGRHTFGDNKTMTLSQSHPVSFRYDTSLSLSMRLHVPGALRDPATTPSGLTPTGTIATDLLDADGKLQCSSCHDVHHSGIGPHHLRYNYEADGGKAMCRTCHNK